MIRPGDFILCDEDGAIVVPAAQVAPVLEAAEELTRQEVLIRREIERGMTLAQALGKYGHV